MGKLVLYTMGGLLGLTALLMAYAAAGGDVKSVRKPDRKRLVAGRCAIDQIGVPTGMGCGRGYVGARRAGHSGGIRRSTKARTRKRGIRLPA